MKPRVLLITPPFTQLNTPYPATPFLTGFLRQRGYCVAQQDLSLETSLGLYSRTGLRRLFDSLAPRLSSLPPRVQWAVEQADQYVDTVDTVVRFLQGRDSTLAHRICHGHLLPEGPRFDPVEGLEEDFGPLGVTDQARYLATLYLNDLGELVRETVAPHYGISRYADRLATAATSFDPLVEALQAPPNLVDQLLEEALRPRLEAFQPTLVGFTVPFPGNLYGALRGAQVVRQVCKEARIVLGGGYANTELRRLKEPRLFDYIDYLLLDDGERPLICLLEHLEGQREVSRLKRTYLKQEGQLEWIDGAEEKDIPMAEWGTPTVEGLPLGRYLSILEVLNPMHRLWTDGQWNKLMVAHGCYWRKCSFCDISLDYIGRYEAGTAPVLVDRMQAMQAETGLSGFHFVDEAAPPLVLRELALEILERGLTVSWWGNIRFEKTYTPDLCRLLAASGCVAVSGGLEAASDRLLALMKKGVSVAQVARVGQAFTQVGIMVHAYLMYGFPSQTLGELVDSLERVRQLFDAGVIHSAFWHRFVATAHAPVGLEPEKFGISLTGPAPGNFAWNDLTYRDPAGCDADKYGPFLDKALFNYQQGRGLDEDVRRFFEGKVPPPSVPKRLIAEALAEPWASPLENPRVARVVWLGGPVKRLDGVGKGRQAVLKLTGGSGEEELKLEARAAGWLEELLNGSRPRGRGGRPYLRWQEALEAYPAGAGPVDGVLKGKVWERLREWGLLGV